MNLMPHPFKFILVPMLLVSSWFADATEINTVHLRGSTTLMPIAQRVAENYMNEQKNVRIVVSGGGTERGYKAIVDGTADVAMASSEPRDDIVNSCNLKNIHLQKKLVGYATILTVVHKSNPVDNLSLKQLKDIFTGRIANWKQVGGKDAAIQVYVGPPNGGINDTWKKLILGEEDSYSPKGIVKNNTERLSISEISPNAITFLTLDASNYSNIKILSINNVIPNDQTVEQGKYILRAPLMLVTTDKPSTATKNFIDYFVTVSHQTSMSELSKMNLLQ